MPPRLFKPDSIPETGSLSPLRPDACGGWIVAAGCRDIVTLLLAGRYAALAGRERTGIVWTTTLRATLFVPMLEGSAVRIPAGPGLLTRIRCPFGVSLVSGTLSILFRPETA